MRSSRRRSVSTSVLAWAPAGWAPVIAQSSDEIIPSDPSARIVFVIIGLAILGLYFLLRRTRRRTEAAYWARKKRDEEMRRADPDMRQDDT